MSSFRIANTTNVFGTPRKRGADKQPQDIILNNTPLSSSEIKDPPSRRDINRNFILPPQRTTTQQKDPVLPASLPSNSIDKEIFVYDTVNDRWVITKESERHKFQ